MGQYKPLTEKNKYYLPKHELYAVIHYCKSYWAWKRELQAVPDSGKAITYDNVRVQTSPGYDPNAELAIQRAMIAKKCERIENTVKEVAPGLYKWLLKGVTTETTYNSLRAEGMPCGKKMYYQCRRRFYYELAKKL